MKKKDKDLLEAYQLPKNPSSDGYYHINVKAIHTGTGKRKQLTAKTLKELKEKLLDVIYEECPEFISYTVKEVFDLWQEHLVCHYNAFEYKYSTLIRFLETNPNLSVLLRLVIFAICILIKYQQNNLGY